MSPQPPLVNLDNKALCLDQQSKEKAILLNETYVDLLNKQAQLKDAKGRLSRLIGQAKKSGESTDELIAQMQTISAQSKKLGAGLDKLRKEAGKLQAPPPEAANAAIAPPGNFIQAPTSAAQSVLEGLEVAPYNDASHREPWTQFVTENKRCSAYHKIEYKDLIEKVFGHKTMYLVAQNSQQTVVGILPCVQLKSTVFGHFLVSMPFFNYGGAIGLNSEIESKLNRALVHLADAIDAQHIEFRNTQKNSDYPSKQTKVAMLLELPEQSDILWDKIGAKVRSQINRAKENHLQVRIGQSELVDDFYRVFARNMRDLGTPVYSKELFSELVSTKALNATIVTIYLDQKPVSCAFLIGHNSTMEIPWASSLRSYNHLNVNMFLYWHVLEHAIEKGYQHFDFGRSSTDSGTYKFKKQWGAKPYPLHWHYWLKTGDQLPELNPNNPKYRLAIKLWQHLPIWLTRIIGPPLVRYLP